MKLLDYCEIVNERPMYFDGQKKYIATGDVNENKIVSFTNVSFNEKPSRANLIIRKNDVIFAKMKNTNKVIFGDENNIDYIYSTGFYCLRCNKNLRPKFLYYYLNSNIFNEIKNNNCNGATMKAINDKGLKNIEVNFPNIEEQDNLINVLDSLYNAIKNRNDALNNYNCLIKSQFVEMFGNPIINEKEWKKCKLNKLCSKIGSGSTPRGGDSVYINEGISLIRSLNVHDNEFIYNNLAHISKEHAEQLKNVIIEQNDVILNITGASVARCCVVPKNVLPARVNQHVSILRPNKDIINSKFLLHLIINNEFKKDLIGISKSGGATREALPKSQLDNLNLILPPIELQNKFAQIVEQIDKQKSIIENDIINLNKLINNIL